MASIKRMAETHIFLRNVAVMVPNWEVSGLTPVHILLMAL